MSNNKKVLDQHGCLPEIFFAMNFAGWICIALAVAGLLMALGLDAFQGPIVDTLFETKFHIQQYGLKILFFFFLGVVLLIVGDLIDPES